MKFFDEGGKITLTLQAINDEQSEIKITGPDEEALRAFLTNYRPFISKKVSFSIRCISKAIKNDETLPDTWKSEFSRKHEKLNTFLSACPLPIEPQVELTRRRIMDVFINGGIFHPEDVEKRKTLQQWMDAPFDFFYIEWEFNNTINHVARIILDISENIKSLLEATVE